MWAETGDASGVWGKVNCSSRSMLKPAPVIAAAVSRLVWQPPGGPDRGVQQPLHPPHAGSTGVDMFEETQLPAGPEHPAQLRQGHGLVGHRAQRQAGDGGVEAAVRGREALGGATDDLHGDGRGTGVAARACVR